MKVTISKTYEFESCWQCPYHGSGISLDDPHKGWWWMICVHPLVSGCRNLLGEDYVPPEEAVGYFRNWEVPTWCPVKNECLTPGGLPRPAVMRFAESMERVLQKNDYKGGWDECKLSYLIDRIKGEYGEAREKWDMVKSREDYGGVAEELIDVANFCMMFWDTIHKERGEKDG